MKTQRILLYVAGIVNLFFVTFHLAFYKMFNWNVDLNNLAILNRAIFLTYHCICILVLFFMATVSLFQAKALLETKLKYSVLGMFILFYIVRIVSEFIFFGYTSSSPQIILMCLLPIVLYIIPLFSKKELYQSDTVI